MNERENNTLSRATALGRHEDGTPGVLVQGSGALADRMVALAGEHGVPVLQDFLLSERLCRVPAGSRIPDPVFEALSAVLAFLQHEDDDADRDTHR